LWLHSLKVAQLLRSAACLHTNQSRSYLNHLVNPLTVLARTTDQSSVNLRHDQQICHFPESFRPSVGPDDPPIQWISEAFSSGVKAAAAIMLTTHPHLVQNLRMTEPTPTFPPLVPSWCGQGQLDIQTQ